MLNKKDIIIDYNLDKNGNKTLKYIDIVTKSHPIEPVILLPQIPNEFNKIEVIFENRHLIKVDKIRDLDNINKIYIDYSKQKIYIHKDLMHKDLKVRYSGIGALKFDINNINYNQEDKLSIIETIDKVANNGEKIFEECLSEGFADKQEVLNELSTKIILGNKSIKDIDNVINDINLDNITNNMTNLTTKIDNIEQEIVKTRSNKSNVKTRLDIQENNINECKDELDGIDDSLSLLRMNIENSTINIGDLVLLKTKNKKNIVEALNELAKKVGIIVTPPPPIPCRWESVPSTSYRIIECTSTHINNTIYCIGGRRDYNPEDFLYSILYYDPTNIEKDFWSEEPTNLLESRMDSVCEAIENDIYIIGGRGTNTVECFDTKTKEIEYKASLPYELSRASSVAVDDYIYVIGGRDSNGNATNNLLRYNPITNIWDTRASMLTARHGHKCIEFNKKIYCFGGDNDSGILNKVEYYDIIKNKWFILPDMIVSKSNFGCAKLGYYVYIIGGTTNENYVVDTIESFNLLTNECKEYGINMTSARCKMAVECINNEIYTIGGYGYGGIVGTVEKFIE